MYVLVVKDFMKNVAKRLNVSTHTIKCIFYHVQYSISPLPEVLCIDELKWNSVVSKYYCILVNPVSHRVLDILIDRTTHILTGYFKQFKTHDKIKVFITDAVPYTKGYIEGCKNKIKVKKHNTFSFINFEKFRNKIFYCYR
jgi:transposase